MPFKVTVSLLLLLQLLIPRLNGDIGTSCTRFDNCAQPYVIVLAADRTGTDANVYQFRRSNRTRTKVEALTEKTLRTGPGLAAYANFPERIQGHLRPLVRFAAATVPEGSQGGGTAIVLAVTAEAVSALTPDQRRAVVRAAAAALRRTPFSGHHDTNDRAQTTVLSGKEVASLAWVGVNFMMGRFESKNMTEARPFGVLDVGDVSTRVAAKSADATHADASRAYTVEHRYWIEPAEFPLHLNSYPDLGKAAAKLNMLGYKKGDTTRLSQPYRTPCVHPEVQNRTFSFGAVSIGVSGDPDTNETNRWSRCLDRAQVALLAGPTVHEAPKTGLYMAIGGYFNVTKALMQGRYLESDSQPMLVMMDNLTQAAELACQSPPKLQHALLCLEAAYLVTLLREGFKFENGRPHVYALNTYPTNVRGMAAQSKLRVGWPLGLAATYVKEPCYIGTPGAG